MGFSFTFLRYNDLHTSLLIMRTRSFLTLLYVRVTYARLVYTWYKNIFRMIAVLILFLAVKKKKEPDENNIKTRQRRDRDETVILFVTQYQGKSTRRCCCQSTWPVVEPLPPPLSSLIPWKHCLSSADPSVIIVVFFIIIFLRRRLRHHRRFLGTIV